MIKTDQQLRNAKKDFDHFTSSVEKILSGNQPNGESSARAAKGQADEILGEINAYKALRAGDLSSVVMSDIYDLPEFLIKVRIGRGISQKQLADVLEVKPQQVQRWESEDYESVGAARLFEIADALGVAGSIKARAVSRPPLAGFTYAKMSWSEFKVTPASAKIPAEEVSDHGLKARFISHGDTPTILVGGEAIDPRNGIYTRTSQTTFAANIQDTTISVSFQERAA